jgi:hypothetical protein
MASAAKVVQQLQRIFIFLSFYSNLEMSLLQTRSCVDDVQRGKLNIVRSDDGILRYASESQLGLLSNRIESNPGVVRFGRIEPDQKKFDLSRIGPNSTRLDSIRS